MICEFGHEGRVSHMIKISWSRPINFSSKRQRGASSILMEFSEASKACALKFLEEFASSQVLPEAEDSLPIRTNWPQLDEGEIEAECLEIGRRYLAGMLVRKCSK